MSTPGVICGTCNTSEPSLGQLTEHIINKHKDSIDQRCSQCKMPKLVVCYVNTICLQCTDDKTLQDEDGYVLPDSEGLQSNNGKTLQDKDGYVLADVEPIYMPMKDMEGRTAPHSSWASLHVYQDVDPRGTQTEGVSNEGYCGGPSLQPISPPFDPWPTAVATVHSDTSTEPLATNTRGTLGTRGSRSLWLKRGLHKVLPTSTCPLCGIKVLSIRFGIHFEKKHHSYQVVCPLCDVTFVLPSHYRTHMQTVHWDIYDDKGSYCHNVLRMVDYCRLLDKAAEGKARHRNRSAPELASSYYLKG